ncbi:MAG: hypothetical protein J7455_20795 [Roseiflexus sp.]|nr:hypothetical protein [Roseiflexus sp.]MBO9390239.1 hypothetical protein [Roseiflexus sp.]
MLRLLLIDAIVHHPSLCWLFEYSHDLVAQQASSVAMPYPIRESTAV